MADFDNSAGAGFQHSSRGNRFDFRCSTLDWPLDYILPQQRGAEFASPLSARNQTIAARSSELCGCVIVGIRDVPEAHVLMRETTVRFGDCVAGQVLTT